VLGQRDTDHTKAMGPYAERELVMGSHDRGVTGRILSEQSGSEVNRIQCSEFGRHRLRRSLQDIESISTSSNDAISDRTVARFAAS